MTEISLRKICDADLELLFLWRNHPAIVLQSMSQKTVSQSDHDDWFRRTMASKDVLPFIIEIDNQPSGHIRFDRVDAHKAHISVYLLPEYTGLGYGVLAIGKALLQVNRYWPGIEIVAEVRFDNPAGQSAFRKCGFELKSLGRMNSPFIFSRRITANETANIELYEKLVFEHGDSHCALNWGSQKGQIRRFEVLSEIGDLNGKSILDVGCGLGHLVDWLGENGISASYTGLELTPGLAHAARNRRPDLEIVNGSILCPQCLSGRSFDYVFASGIFYTYVDNGYAVLRDSIAGMWNLCSLGIAFNSLSTWANEKELNEFYADPSVVLNIAREFTPWVILRHDYHARDFTVYMKRERSNQ